MKFVHIAIHCCIILAVYHISCKYFFDASVQKGKTNHKAQLIAFILVANPYDKAFFSLMFNDEIMILYLLVAIYMILNN